MSEINWDKSAKNYDQEVYSITKWKSKRDKILKELKDNSRILILGAGSEVYLQKDIIEKFPKSKIVLSDYFPQMLKVSKKKFNHENLSFKKEDMREMDYDNEFDFIISTNSILMPTIKENLKVFNLCNKALKRGGKLISYLPSYESCLNLVEKCPEAPFILKHKQQVLKDPVDGTEQSFHSLKSIDEASRKFRSQGMVKVYCSESKEELDHLDSLYGSIIPKNISKQIFEWFVVLTK